VLSIKNITDSKIKVAILDTGVKSSHYLLQGRSITGCTLILKDGKVVVKSGYEDQLGHGTAVTQIIASTAPECSITMFRIFDDSYALDENVLVAALNWLANHHDYDIINISAGVIQTSQLAQLYDACKANTDKGTIIVSAFDNAGAISYPAAFDIVLGVDSGVSCNRRSEFEYMSKSIVNIGGYGKRQSLAWHTSDYVADEGNSFACASVTGQLALFLEGGASGFDDVKRKFREIAIKIHDEVKSVPESISIQFPKIKKALIFPFNKEMHSLLRFHDMLPFEITAVCHTRYSGLVNASIGSLLSGHNMGDHYAEMTIMNINTVRDDVWREIDTLILGHCKWLSELTHDALPLNALICKAIQENKNIYSFDPLIGFDDLINNPQYQGNVYWPEATLSRVPQNRFGKLHQIVKPIIGVYGTASRLGKFSLQLELRRIFMKKGYNVGQFGTEPQSLLFGFDEVYHCGHNSAVSLSRWDAFLHLNELLSSIEKKENDLLIVGSQAAVLPESLTNMYTFSPLHLEFICAMQADAIILCVGYNDKKSHIINIIKAVEGLSKATVVGLVLFPLIEERDNAGITAGTRMTNTRKMTKDELVHKKMELNEWTNIPVYGLMDEDDLLALVDRSIDFFAA